MKQYNFVDLYGSLKCSSFNGYTNIDFTSITQNALDNIKNEKTLLTNVANPDGINLLQDFFYEDGIVDFERFSFTDFAVTEDGVFILAKEFISKFIFFYDIC